MKLANPRSVAALVATGILASVSLASAQSAEAEVLFRDGKKLLKAGKLAAGCDKIEASERLESSVGTLLNLGDCRERLGRLASGRVGALAADLRHRYGRVDGLVANAGITWRARLADLDPADLARVPDVNLTGTLLGIQALTPLMPAGGSIVVIGSVAALTGHYPVAYTASKWALRGLAKAACLELGPRGIRVNTVHPGYIETPMTASAAPAFRDANIAETPLGRTGTVDEVAPAGGLPDQRRRLVHHRRGDPRRRRLTAHGGVKSISDAVRPTTDRLIAREELPCSSISRATTSGTWASSRP